MYTNLPVLCDKCKQHRPLGEMKRVEEKLLCKDCVEKPKVPRIHIFGVGGSRTKSTKVGGHTSVYTSHYTRENKRFLCAEYTKDDVYTPAFFKNCGWSIRRLIEFKDSTTAFARIGIPKKIPIPATLGELIPIYTIHILDFYGDCKCGLLKDDKEFTKYIAGCTANCVFSNYNDGNRRKEIECYRVC